MLLEQMSWMDVENYLKNDDRLVIVTGSTENHGYLSLATDTLSPWEVAKKACEIEKIVLAPALPYGICPHWMAYPGTVSISPQTYLGVIADILSSFIHHGFKKILILNGHGTNEIMKSLFTKFRQQNTDVMIKFRHWYQLPNVVKFMEKYNSHENQHASWIEGFPWINQVGPSPKEKKPDFDWTDYDSLTPEEVRKKLGDGSGGGLYSMEENIMREYFQIAVQDVVNIYHEDWAS